GQLRLLLRAAVRRRLGGRSVHAVRGRQRRHLSDGALLLVPGGQPRRLRARTTTCGKVATSRWPTPSAAASSRKTRPTSCSAEPPGQARPKSGRGGPGGGRLAAGTTGSAPRGAPPC